MGGVGGVGGLVSIVGRLPGTYLLTIQGATGALVLGEWLLARSPGFYALSDVSIDELAAKAPKAR